MSSSHHIGSYDFKAWKDVHDYCRVLLSKGARQLPQKDQEFVIGLMSYHPYGKLRLRAGVQAVAVARASVGTGFCFSICDRNGVWTDFSYKKTRAKNIVDASSSQVSDMNTKRLRAYRGLVESQTLIAKRSLKQNCQCCGKLDDLAVDHIIPFVHLVNEFERLSGYTSYPRIVYDRNRNNGLVFSELTPAEANFCLAWIAFHQKYATFQMLCKSCNSSKGSMNIRYNPTLRSPRAA